MTTLQTGRISAVNQDKLPDLTDVYFFRPLNRNATTGGGRLAPAQSPVRRRITEIGFALCTLLLVGIAAVALFNPATADRRLAAFAVLPVLGAGCLWVAMRDQRKHAQRQARLAREGKLVLGTLTACRFVMARKVSAGSFAPGSVLQFRYRFATPDGQPFEKGETIDYLPFDLKTLPPLGTRILILYVDREVCAAL